MHSIRKAFYIHDPNLSWKAKGLLTYILSMPETWVPKERKLISVSSDGYHSVRSAIHELISNHYMVLKYHANDSKIPVNKSIWYVSDKRMK